MMYCHLVLATLCVVTLTTATPTSFNTRGTIENAIPTDETCCSISHCKEVPLNTEGHSVFQCYKTKVCGEECLHKQNKNLPPLPTYRRKNYYVRKMCRGYDCYDYAYDCRKCPDPSKPSFSPYTIDADCINCYY
ncbi:uncharacterized protein LOC114348255 [Diabrotica virgifera virgifera]|uniref:Uncharacterized protein n=1 Tax=Diabrotica virgifera virgifera TaxID=50390 RepID=A0ABM5IZZ8_DIAVI|nr:uncharacterized protein LOC114348255 [Diabrotica virgifera virgifera]